jgi:hypothetical protein
VAIDRACIDMVNNSLVISGSMTEVAGVMEREEKFNAIVRLRWEVTPGATHITPDWKIMLDAAKKQMPEPRNMEMG